MKKFLLAAICALGLVGATAPSALANTSDTCFDPATFGIRPAACQAATVESRVDVAQVTFGLHSSGWFNLVCARGDDIVQRSGRVGVGGRRTITSDRLGLTNPTCFLAATAIADSPSHNARVTVSLFD
jgi:hypothetical protein